MIGIIALIGVIFILVILACIRDRWAGSRRTARTILLMQHLNGLPLDVLDRFGQEEARVQRYWPDPQNDTSPGTSDVRLVHLPIERVELGLGEDSERGLDQLGMESDPFVREDPFLYQDRSINQSIQSLNMGINVEDF